MDSDSKPGLLHFLFSVGTEPRIGPCPPNRDGPLSRHLLSISSRMKHPRCHRSSQRRSYDWQAMRYARETSPPRAASSGHLLRLLGGRWWQWQWQWQEDRTVSILLLMLTHGRRQHFGPRQHSSWVEADGGKATEETSRESRELTSAAAYRRSGGIR